MLYIPLTYLSYLFESTIWGLRPAVVHFNNLMLHISNTLLVLLLFISFGGRIIGIILGTTAFAIHPMMVEPVVWSMGRKDLLSTFMALVALLTYYRMIKQGRKRWHWISFFAFSLALLAKPTVIILPGLLLLIDLYCGGSVTPRQVVLKIPYLLLGILIFGVSLGMPAEQPQNIPTLPYRILQLPSLVSGWILRIALLQTPNPFYCWSSNSQWQMTVISTLCIILIFGFFIYFVSVKKAQGLLFGVLFFVIGALPALSLIITPREFITADRYGYFPLVGLFYGITAGVSKLTGRSINAYFAFGTLWLIAAFLTAHYQINVWKTSINLWTKAKEGCTDNVLIYNNLGMAYADSNDIDRAVIEFKQGLEISPNYIPIYNNLGRMYFDQRNPHAARTILESAVSIAPNNALANKNLGDVYLHLGLTEEAIKCFQKSIAAKPDNVPSYISLGNYLLQNNRLDEAETIYQKGLEYDSKNPDIHLNLGIIYENQGLHSRATVAYKQAISHNPRLVDAHYNLANIYSSQHRFHLAEQEYQLALNYDPNHIEAAINLGNLYFRAGNLDGAERWYQTAVRLQTDKNPFPHYNLGQIYLRKQELEKTIDSLTAALKIQPDFGEAHYEISKAYFLQKDTANAKRHLDKASQLGVAIDQKFVEKLNQQAGNDESTPE